MKVGKKGRLAQGETYYQIPGRKGEQIAHLSLQPRKATQPVEWQRAHSY